MSHLWTSSLTSAESPHKLPSCTRESNPTTSLFLIMAVLFPFFFHSPPIPVTSSTLWAPSTIYSLLQFACTVSGPLFSNSSLQLHLPSFLCRFPNPKLQSSFSCNFTPFPRSPSYSSVKPSFHFSIMTSWMTCLPHHSVAAYQSPAVLYAGRFPGNSHDRAPGQREPLAKQQLAS